MKMMLLIIKLLGVFLLIGCTSEQIAEPNMLLDYGQAVSLRVLQERVEDGIMNGNCPNELLTMCGLTKIYGYVLDETNQDVILFGEADSESPPLYTEEFVVALRNAWLKYATIQGNTHYYSNPGCSIDPDPNVIAQLDEIGSRFLADRSISGINRAISSWCNTCSTSQNVKVLGIPFSTRFSKVMVDADYYMKNLTNGSVQLGIAGFESLTDLTLERLREDIINNRPISVRIGTLNRFEFYPGENVYQEDEGIIFIEKCPVTLITEEEYLSKSGDISGTGRPDPLAQQFADSFSVHYAKISKKKPIYFELEGLFRTVALVKILKYKDVAINLDYFLERFPISMVPVDSTLPGISHVKDFEHRFNYQDGCQIIKLWLPSCGGVSIDINVRSENFKQPQLHEFRQAIVDARNSNSQLNWVFGKKRRRGYLDGVLTIQQALRQGKSLDWMINELSEDATIYAIDQLSDGEILVLHKQDDEFIFTAVYDENVNTMAKGNEAIFQYEEIMREKCEQASDRTTNFIHAGQQGNDIILQIGKEKIRMSIKDMTELINTPKATQTMAIDQVFSVPTNTAFIIRRDALARRVGPNSVSVREGTPTDPVRLTSALNQRFQGKMRFYLDDEFDLAKENYYNIRPIKKTDDLVVLIPEESIGIQDHEFVKSIKSFLQESDIRVVHDPSQIGEALNVLIISGHNDEQLFEYLKSLGERGVLREKLIILNTCYAGSNPDKLHDLIQQYGARGFYHHTETINPNAIARSLEHVVEILKEIQSQAKEINPYDLFQQAVDRVLQDPYSSPQLQKELEKLKKGVIQISEIYFKPSQIQFTRNIYG